MGGVSSTEKFASKLEAACELEGFKREDIVASSTAKDCVYLAVKLPSGEVIGVACIVETRKHRGEVETYAKAMSEGMHPFYYEASAKVLDALSPTTDEGALAWRAKCRKILALKSSVRPGARFVVKEAVPFKSKRSIEVGACVSVCEVKRTKIVMLAPSFGLFAMNVDQLEAYLTPANEVVAAAPPKPAPHSVTTVAEALEVLADDNADQASIDAALALLA